MQLSGFCNLLKKLTLFFKLILLNNTTIFVLIFYNQADIVFKVILLS